MTFFQSLSLARKAFILLIYSLLLNYCSNSNLHQTKEIHQDSAPNLDGVDLTQIPDAIPQQETWARYGNHSPYHVLGKTYQVNDSNEHFKQKGIASWYGTKFHGRLTSTREPYDMLAMTAAHKTLPLPSYVLVTNVDNQKQVVVKVNDRGPFVEGRIIDLSYAAAHKIDMHEQGIAQVEIEVLPPFLSKPSKTSQTLSQKNKVVLKRIDFPNGSNNYIQVGVFANKDAAQRLKSSLLEDFPQNSIKIKQTPDQKPLHKVRVGPLSDYDQFLKAQDLLRKRNLPHYYVISE